MSRLWTAMQGGMVLGQTYSVPLIYDLVSERVGFDADDLRDNGYGEPNWQRNVRNVLFSRKRRGDLVQELSSEYGLVGSETEDTTANKMARICGLVGIAPVAPLRGSTEPFEFFAGVADALGVTRRRVDGRSMTKREIAEAIVTLGGLNWDPAWDGRATPSRGGGSISNPGLDQLERAAQNILSGRIPQPNVDALARLEGGGARLDIVRARMVIAERLARAQATAFREAVLAAYDGRCAISGTPWPAIIEAAHIDPFATSLDNRLSNGIALRADIHVLFDRHLLLVRPTDMTAHFLPGLALPREYAQLNGRAVALPADAAAAPSMRAFEKVWALYWPR